MEVWSQGGITNSVSFQGAFSFRLQDVPMITNIFNMYKTVQLVGVKIRCAMVQWPTASPNIAPGTAQMTTANASPTIYYYFDPDDDEPPASLAAAMGQQGVRKFTFNPQRPVMSAFVKPRQQMSVSEVTRMDSGGNQVTVSDVGVPIRARAINIQTVDGAGADSAGLELRHYAWKFLFTDAVPSTAGPPVQTGHVFRWDFVYYLACKFPIIEDQVVPSTP